MAPRRSLRALDWRVLLPIDPPVEHAVLIDADEETAAAALAVGLARRITTTVAATDPADLIVLGLAGSPDVDQTVAGLRPGGVLVWPVDRSRRGQLRLTPRTIRARIRATGLSVEAAYWSAVAGDSPIQRMLPLEAGHAIRWYLDAMRGRGGPIRVSLRWLGRAIAGDRPLLEALVPRHITIARRPSPTSDLGSAGGGGPEERAAGLLAASGLPGRRLVVHSGGDGDWSRITVFPFADADRVPTGVIKGPRWPASADATAHEQDVLLDLAERLPAPERSSVPEALRTPTWGGVPVAVQGYRAGGPTRHDDDVIVAATDWLAMLAASTTTASVPAARLHDDPRIGGRLERYLAMTGRREADVHLVERVVAVGTGADRDWPIGTCHLDVGPWNLRLGAAGLVVLDWEGARDGPLGTDLIFLLAHRAARSGAGRRASSRSAAVALATPWTTPGGPDPARDPTRRSLDRYLVATGIDRRYVPLMVVLAFTEQALERERRLGELGPYRGERPSDGLYRAVVEHLAAADPSWIGALARIGTPTGDQSPA